MRLHLPYFWLILSSDVWATFALPSNDVTAAPCVPEQPTVKAPHINVWLGLTDEEARGVVNLLHQESTGLNLTWQSVGSWDNTLRDLEFLQPNKTDVLPFIAGHSATPDRYARATIIFRATEVPYIEDYMVGPLPVTPDTQVRPLDYVYNRKSTKVPLPVVDVEAVEKFNHEAAMTIAEITTSLWNKTADDGIVLTTPTIPSKEGNSTILWSAFFSKPTSQFDAETLLPLPLYLKSDVTGRQTENWRVAGWVYDDHFYETTEELIQAFAQLGFAKLPPNLEGGWSSTDPDGESMPLDNLTPPVLVQPGSKRFLVDEEQRYVSWMGFSFYLSWNHIGGLRIFDIRFKGEKIIYELGLEEAFSHYAGNNPFLSSAAFLDGAPGFGPYASSLIDGFDCPTYSTYLNTTNWDRKTMSFFTRLNSICTCLFESDQGYPIQRHATSKYASVTRNIAFTVRYIPSVGNYDYTLDYKFFLDGSIEVSVRASGYILSGYAAHNEQYGFRIHDNLSGAMHDHVLTYKVDFDIHGEKNSLQKIDFAPTTVDYPWSKGFPRNTMKIMRDFIDNESKSKLNWAANGAALYSVVNKEKPNIFGEYPGYRFFPATGNAIHSTVLNSSTAHNATNFGTHAFYATRQKDTEPHASHQCNGFDVETPLIDFNKFFNEESLDQEDLVIWFNLGNHHLPSTGDLPNTVFTTSHSAMTIQPQNYVPHDPSRATIHQARVDYDGEGNVINVERFGAENATCSNMFQPDLWRYGGKVTDHQYQRGAQPSHTVHNASILHPVEFNSESIIQKVLGQILPFFGR